MRSIDNNWDLMKDAEVLEDCELLYPEEAICFRPVGKDVSKDGATVKLAPFLSLSENTRGRKYPGDALIEVPERAEELLCNGKDLAFLGDAGHLVRVKHEGTGHYRYLYVAKGTSVGQLCFLIAREYETLLDVWVGVELRL